MANVNSSENCLTVLQEVVQCEDCTTDVMKLLLDNGAELTRDILNRAVLSKRCKIETIKFLLENGAELTCDVLNNAVKVEDCKFEVVRLLIQYGALIDLWVLEDAVANRGVDVEIIKLLLENGAELPCSILNNAVQTEGCQYRVIKFLLDSGAQNHVYVLRDAIANGRNNFAVVKLLLERKTYSYSDSIQMALISGASFEMIKFLFENGCKIESCEFHMVVLKRKVSVELWKIMIENGVKVTECLLSDVINGGLQSIEVIKLLLQNVGELSSRILFHIRFKDKEKKYSIQIIKLLLESGVKPDTSFLKYIIENYDDEIELLRFFLKSDVECSVSVFKSCKIKSSNIYYFKILLQYILFQWFKNEIFELKVSLQHVILEAFNFDNITLYQEMCIFLDCLIKDLTEMKKDKIKQNFSLFSFMSDQCSINPIIPLEYNLIDKVLSKFYSGNYICCRDLLYASFSEIDLCNKLCKIDIHVKSNSYEIYSGKKVSLNPDIILYLVSFLKKEDIVNLILAFLQGKKENTLKRKRFYVNRKLNENSVLAKRIKLH